MSVARLALGILALFLTATVAHAHGLPEADKRLMVHGGDGVFILLGAKHMLTGYDHLLFLLGVMFFLKRLVDVIEIITAFTVGHSITLLFATLWNIQASYDLVDAAIALTICYKGFENLDGFKKILLLDAPPLIPLVFVFGLIHGFGLSTRLQAVNLDGDGLAGKILCFNLGVEIGQVVALYAMWVVLSTWRNQPSFLKFSRVSNLTLGLVGGLLLLMNLHGYIHTAYPRDFPINRVEHARIHEAVDEEVPLMPPEELPLPQKPDDLAPSLTPKPKSK